MDFSVSDEQLADLRRRINFNSLARQGDGRGTQRRRGATRDDAKARAVLGERLRLAQGAGETERHSAIHDADRWRGHSFHPRSFEKSQMRCRSSSRTDGPARSSSNGRSRFFGPAHRSNGIRRKSGGLPSTLRFRRCLATASPTSCRQAPGWTPVTIAKAWATLMQRLGYTRYVAQGGDWGNAVSEVMALQQPPGLLGIHTNMAATVPPDVSKRFRPLGRPQVCRPMKTCVGPTR